MRPRVNITDVVSCRASLEYDRIFLQLFLAYPAAVNICIVMFSATRANSSAMYYLSMPGQY